MIKIKTHRLYILAPVILGWLAIPAPAIPQDTPAPPKAEAKPAPNPAEAANIDYSKGEEFYRQFQFNRAAEHFKQAVDKVGDPLFYLALGNSQYQLEQYDDAIKNLESALRLAQQKGNKKVEGDSLNSLGLVYKTQSKYEQAADYYRRGLKVRQDLADLQGEAASKYNLACALSEMGKTEEAIALMQDVARTEQMLKMLDATNLVPMEKVFHCDTMSRGGK